MNTFECWGMSVILTEVDKHLQATFWFVVPLAQFPYIT